ncbi:MAG TPA: flagellar type III secretion system pore protein FliP [Acidobacteriaceae bacterium]|jgi:flagellar biosynthetic protein FliP|nr:flagellar type III secretion system pore protein FliP [Acidobacteriaceae bacterium]
MIQRLQTCALCAGMLLTAAATAAAQAHVPSPAIDTPQARQPNTIASAAPPPQLAPNPQTAAAPQLTAAPNGAAPATPPNPAAAAPGAPAPTPAGTPAATPAATTPAATPAAAPTASKAPAAKAIKRKPTSEDPPPTGPVDSSLHLQPGMGATGIQLPGVPGGSVPWSIVILLTGLTLVPAILLCVTPFARLLIVFHFLRQALGLQTTPSNQTLIGLSLILTFFLMQPVATQIYDTAVVPMQAGQISATVALDRGEQPLRKFMSHYVRDKDVALFIELAKEPQPKSIDDVSMRVLLPAYILSELKAGFQIGTVLFLPFLVVDMVVASITTSVGMLQLPPVVISTPLKLLLFLMVDGWHLLIGSLMRSFS